MFAEQGRYGTKRGAMFLSLASHIHGFRGMSFEKGSYFPKIDREMGIDTMAAYGHLLAAYSESAETQAE